MLCQQWKAFHMLEIEWATPCKAHRKLNSKKIAYVLRVGREETSRFPSTIFLFQALCGKNQNTRILHSRLFIEICETPQGWWALSAVCIAHARYDTAYRPNIVLHKITYEFRKRKRSACPYTPGRTTVHLSGWSRCSARLLPNCSAHHQPSSSTNRLADRSHHSTGTRPMDVTRTATPYRELHTKTWDRENTVVKRSPYLP